MGSATAVYGWRQQQTAQEQAQRANAGRLAIAAEKEKDRSIGLALLFANEAVGATKSEPTPEAQSALLSALLANPRLKKILHGHEDSVQSVASSPDGKRLALASWDKAVRLWDAESGHPLGAPLTVHDGPVLSIAFSLDGKRLASASENKTVRLWDAESGQPLGGTGHDLGRVGEEALERSGADGSPDESFDDGGVLGPMWASVQTPLFRSCRLHHLVAPGARPQGDEK